MRKIKCITFDKDFQNNIPNDVRDKMNINRAESELRREMSSSAKSYNKHMTDVYLNSKPLCELIYFTNSIDQERFKETYMKIHGVDLIQTQEE